MSRDDREAVRDQTASRSPASTLSVANWHFLRCIGARLYGCMHIRRRTCTGCAIHEFEIRRSKACRRFALGSDRLGCARAVGLGARPSFKPAVLWLTYQEAWPQNSMYQPPLREPRQPSGGIRHAAKRRKQAENNVFSKSLSRSSYTQ
jgi:hypothetical protein